MKKKKEPDEIVCIRFENKLIKSPDITFQKDELFGYLKVNIENDNIKKLKHLIILSEYFGAGNYVQVFSDYACVYVRITFTLKNIKYKISNKTIVLSRNEEAAVYKNGVVCPHCNAMM